MNKMRKFFMVMVTCFLVALVATPMTSEAAKAPKLSKKTASIVVGKSVQLSVKNTKKKVKWSTSNKKIATVSQKGLVKGNKVGKVTITAKVGKKKLNCKVTVKVGLNKTSMKLWSGDKITLALKGTKAKVTWSTSNKDIATISQKGMVTARKTGTAKITAKVGKKKYTCKVTVKNIDIDTKTMKIQNSGYVAYLVANKGSLRATSSNKNIAEVELFSDEFGFGSYCMNVYAHKSGTATITITNTYDNDKATIKVTVQKPKDSCYQRLVDYVITKGTYDSAMGGRFIETTPMKSSIGTKRTGIGFDVETSSLTFTVLDSSDDMTQMETVILNVTEKSLKGKADVAVMITKMVEEDSEFEDLFGGVSMLITATSLPVSTYDGTDLKFDISQSINFKEDAQVKGNTMLKDAMKEWDALLQNRLKFGFKELGFVKYVNE